MIRVTPNYYEKERYDRSFVLKIYNLFEKIVWYFQKKAHRIYAQFKNCIILYIKKKKKKLL